MSRIYANENFPLPAVDVLRNLGHDVMTTADSGKAGFRFSDEEVMGFAQAERRIIVTMNRRHFVVLHQKIPDHAGIIVCTLDPNFSALAERVHQVLEEISDFTGVLVRVNRPNE